MLKKYKSMTSEEYESEMRRLSAKMFLTRAEACEYFNIGASRMDKLLTDKPEYLVFNGNKALIDRESFYNFLMSARRV